MRRIATGLCAVALLTACGQQSGGDEQAVAPAAQPSAVVASAGGSQERAAGESQRRPDSGSPTASRAPARANSTAAAKAVTIADLDAAVAQVRAIPQLAKAPQDQAQLWLKAVCSARAAGIEDAQVSQMFAHDLEPLAGQDAPKIASKVVEIASKKVCP